MPIFVITNSKDPFAIGNTPFDFSSVMKNKETLGNLYVIDLEKDQAITIGSGVLKDFMTRVKQQQDALPAGQTLTQGQALAIARSVGQSNALKASAPLLRKAIQDNVPQVVVDILNRLHILPNAPVGSVRSFSPDGVMLHDPSLGPGYQAIPYEKITGGPSVDPLAGQLKYSLKAGQVQVSSNVGVDWQRFTPLPAISGGTSTHGAPKKVPFTVGINITIFIGRLPK
jgi:hypothetical protein